MDINLCYLGPFFLKSKGQNLQKKIVPSCEIFWGGNVNYVIFFRKLMKISQDAKKRRKNILENCQNGFDDGEGTNKKDYNKISQ